MILNHNSDVKDEMLSVDSLVEQFEKNVTVEQKKGLDIINITASSPSPYEASLITNCYAAQYRNLNLEINRNQLTYVKNFLNRQKEEKQRELDNAEDSLRHFRKKGV